MAKNKSDPPAKKIGPEDIEHVFDNRDKLGFANLTAGKIADVLVEDLDSVDELNSETVRNHLTNMQESDEYDIAKFKLGPRTVVYGRKDDPKKVVADGGSGIRTILAELFKSAVMITFVYMVMSLAVMANVVPGDTQIAILLSLMAYSIMYSIRFSLRTRYPEWFESWLQNSRTGRRVARVVR